ncbi:MAG: cob(I)yrinic acid a,c-diamide adenosyltransferase [Paludibacteraceae bacterium]|nr:cob(I)yrinic acid a,c-diamide adenosyltransferase [Paludibacteraceae bacterium]
MKIYTKTGDSGFTSLANGKRVAKTDLRLEAYGTADELNSWVGLVRARAFTISNSYDEWLDYIQNKLFNLGALLSDAQGDGWIRNDDVTQLEQYIDTLQEQLEPLRAFILPGGSEAIATCHICRTVTRRLERQMVALYNNTPNNQECSSEQTDTPHTLIALQWVNRLSDFWFVLARKIAKDQNISPFLWKK